MATELDFQPSAWKSCFINLSLSQKHTLPPPSPPKHTHTPATFPRGKHTMIGALTYKLGLTVIFFQRLSGLLPFTGEDEDEVEKAVADAKWTFDAKAFAHVTTEAMDFISKLLVKAAS